MAATPTAPLPSNTPDDTPRVVEHDGVKAIKAPLYIVNYVDGTGKEETRLAVVLGKNEVRFLRSDALTGPAQTWLRDKILIATGRLSPDELAAQESQKVSATPIPVSSSDDVDQI